MTGPAGTSKKHGLDPHRMKNISFIFRRFICQRSRKFKPYCGFSIALEQWNEASSSSWNCQEYVHKNDLGQTLTLVVKMSYCQAMAVWFWRFWKSGQAVSSVHVSFTCVVQSCPNRLKLCQILSLCFLSRYNSRHSSWASRAAASHTHTITPPIPSSPSYPPITAQYRFLSTNQRSQLPTCQVTNGVGADWSHPMRAAL